MFSYIFLLVGALWAAATPQVTAQLSASQMRPGETFQLTIAIKTEEEVEVDTPSWQHPAGIQVDGMQTQTAFESHLVPGPQGMQFDKKRSVEFIYSLRATTAGKYKLGPFILKIDNHKYELEAVNFVANAKAPPAPSAPGRLGGGGLFPPGFEDEEDSLFGQLLRRQRQQEQTVPSRTLPINEKEAFFIIVETDKKEAYEGEQIFASWYIYTRGNIHQFDRLKFPALKGFWKEDVEPAPNLNFEKERVNGILFHRALLASYALFPIKPGEATIDEYKIRALVSLPNETMGGFGGFAFGQPYSYTRSSKLAKVLIKALPTEGKPQNFSGAVGNFSVRASVDNQRFVQGQPFTLRLRFDGDGNAKLIELPKLQWPASFELYDTKSESRFFQSGKSFKEFTMLVIPKEQGVQRLPPFEFSYFDPTTASYKTIQTQEISLQVAPGQVQSGQAERLSLEKQKPDAVTLKLPEPIAASEAPQWHWLYGLSMLIVWTALYAGLFLSFILAHWLWLKRLNHRKNLMDELDLRKQKWEKVLKKSQWPLAATEVINAIYFMLSRLVDAGGFTRDLSYLLDQLPPSLRNAVAEPLSKELEIMQTVAFAPEGAWKSLSSEVEFRKHADRTHEILRQMVKLAEEGTVNL